MNPKQEQYFRCLISIDSTKRSIHETKSIEKLTELINNLDNLNRDERLISKTLTDAEIKEALYAFAFGGSFMRWK
jgi:hypothetical protein